ncbi:hypothetical protein FFLO_03464 [Filobasidium floriforme]|uniref:Uncharacterized protein n=1 Tax=Filobasidium floriforme TaxID=5210 RepID=A0A8K0NQV5_9TREE|nr:uncharacterized protein HD553DRAFT_335429 [Filobasidium floriforme]KAG7539665.1 hypothetical protein FFLO_03464 [Filobasidium floriforme]KAH8084804.1 hypothetical protein HD553DRAFT_335429 [Filobasidium floriforme]
MSPIVRFKDFFRKVYYIKPPASPMSQGRVDEEHALQSTKTDVESPPASPSITDDQLQRWWTSAWILQIFSEILAISNIMDLCNKCGWTVIWCLLLQFWVGFTVFWYMACLRHELLDKAAKGQCCACTRWRFSCMVLLSVLVQLYIGFCMRGEAFRQ